MAGINAARRVHGKDPVVLRRDEAYIGVLIDDLVTKGTTEPYRMFTSRAEYRLLLRQDNADMRLSQLGYDLGLLPERNYRRFATKRDAIATELARLAATRTDAILRRPEANYRDLPSHNSALPDEVIQQVEIEIKYAGYIDRQEAEIEKFRTLEDKQIPDWLDYNSVPSLRTEARTKLQKVRPATLGQASRISGVSPSDVAILTVWIKRGKAPMVN
jgi:tRNA uridine 5-carboxymethylaminomethyl modification enzyme